MKTTLEIPDAIFRRAKAKAAEQGVPLRQLVSEAVTEKLEMRSPARERTMMKLAGVSATCVRRRPESTR